MHRDRPEAGRHPCRASNGILLLTAGLSFFGDVPGAMGDVFRLTNGGVVEGQLQEKSSQSYTVRTAAGTLVLPADAVAAVESAPTSFEEYDARVQSLSDTAESHTTLAEWCSSNELPAERRKHLLRAIELDRDYAPARAALGFVQVGSMWVDGRDMADRTVSPAIAEDRDAADAKLVAAVQSQWTRRIRSIRVGLLESPLERRVDEGWGRILEIRDPLAILPLTRALAGGNRTCRTVLVKALSAFPQDEATLNLAILALSDAAADIRRAALVELVSRDDTRVAAQFRKALDSNNDELIRRASIGLGELKAAEAVPDLIEALTVQRHKRVEVPVRTYFGDWQQVFNRPTQWNLSHSTRIHYGPQVGVFDPATGVTVENVFRVQQVTVYRTEVLEALKVLTGQNFGFDATAWRSWYEEQRS